MAELTTTSTAAVVGAVGLASMIPHFDGNAVIGAFAGAALLVVSSKELTLTQRFAYLGISLVAGYLAVPEILRLTPIKETGIAAFFGSALVTTITLQMLERVKNLDLMSFFKKGN